MIDLLSLNEYTFPEHIKRKVKTIFRGKRLLPVIINDSESQASSQPPSKQTSNGEENFVL